MALAVSLEKMLRPNADYLKKELEFGNNAIKKNPGALTVSLRII